MNNAKAYLRGIRLLDTKINNKLADLAMLRDMRVKITASMSPGLGGSSGEQDKLGDATAKILDLEKEINADIDTLVDMKRAAIAIIDKVTDTDQYDVLHKRYLQYKTWEQIACKLGMTYRNVCYIHSAALQVATEIMEGG